MFYREFWKLFWGKREDPFQRQEVPEAKATLNILLLFSTDTSFLAQAFAQAQASPKAVSMENSVIPSEHCTGVSWALSHNQLPKVQEEDRPEQSYNEIHWCLYYKNKKEKKKKKNHHRDFWGFHLTII